MQKWEYVVIYGLSSGFTGRPRAYYLTSKGFELFPYHKDMPPDISEQNALGQFIARLGDEGWELTGTGNTSQDYHCIYFKRPVQS